MSRNLLRTLSELTDADFGDLYSTHSRDAFFGEEEVGGPLCPSGHNKFRRMGSRRNLALVRSFSKRLVRTISDLAHQEDDDESLENNSASDDSSFFNEDEVNEDQDSDEEEEATDKFVVADNKRVTALSRSLSKRLIRGLSQMFEEESVDRSLDIFGDFDTRSMVSNTPEAIACVKYDDKGTDKEVVDKRRIDALSKTLSKRLIRSLSQMFEEESIDRSLDIFGDFETRSMVSSAPDAIAFAGNESEGKIIESEDGFDEFMLSLVDDEGFNNSLDDWMGSVSDVFDDKKEAISSTLTEQDINPLEISRQDVNELTGYLRKCLSYRNLLPTCNEDEPYHKNRCKQSPRRRRKPRRGRRPAREEATKEDNAIAPPPTFSSRPFEVNKSSPKTADNAPCRPVRRPPSPETPSKILVQVCDEKQHSTTNASRPVRVPSPVNEPAPLQDFLTTKKLTLPYLESL